MVSSDAEKAKGQVLTLALIHARAVTGAGFLLDCSILVSYIY
jgi:hypothetical protein